MLVDPVGTSEMERREERASHCWRVLEFYSGIGAMRYSLMKAAVRAEVVQAFDINNTANDAYQHNFGHRPYQGNIQSISPMEIDKYEAHAWLLSPPCQPYTRQGLQKHSADARATSFITLVGLIPQMTHPPSMLFVENVVGFETSDTRMQLIDLLAENGFVVQEYILSPLQFGIPYSRPRYFCLAKRKPLSFQSPSFNNRLLLTPVPFTEDASSNQLESFCKPIKCFLEGQTSAKDPDNGTGNKLQIHALEAPFTAGNDFDSHPYMVPLSLIDRWGSAMDVVFPDSKRCCCFTKSYYRYVKGTGSLLATNEPETKSESYSLRELALRYFTPREVANLHSFPEAFSFPSHITLKQQYALLGNSLSIAVVTPLLQYLFREPT